MTDSLKAVLQAVALEQAIEVWPDKAGVHVNEQEILASMFLAILEKRLGPVLAAGQAMADGWHNEGYTGMCEPWAAALEQAVRG